MKKKHYDTVKPHNGPLDSMDGFKIKDDHMSEAMANVKKGMTTCTTHRGNSSNYKSVDTEYGSKPEMPK